MSTEESADSSSDDSDSPAEGYKELRAQLRNLPRRPAPASFEAELERRLTSRQQPPIVRVLRMRPFLAIMTTLGGLLIFLSFFLFPGGVDTTRSSAVSPATEISQDASKAQIYAKTDTAGGDTLAGVKSVSTALP